MARKPSEDDQVMELIEKVKQKRAEIQRIEKPNWQTNCSFSFIEGQSSGATNIHVVSDVRKLTRIAAFLCRLDDDYIKAGLDLGVDPLPEFAWDGYTLAEWVSDLALRVSEIQLASKKSSLEALQKRLDAIISPELKRKMELEAIAAEVG
jgi:hypothetical protein